jgi:IS4 transposase
MHRNQMPGVDLERAVGCRHSLGITPCGALRHRHLSDHYPERLRGIRFRDAETGKALVFLTNQATLPTLRISALYKSRWQVEALSRALCRSRRLLLRDV